MMLLRFMIDVMRWCVNRMGGREDDENVGSPYLATEG